jgi:AmmeMemoRadiSam system protein B/AmmeMemoRadiSam system protein A
MATIHISPYAGEWYPAAAAELKTLLDGRFAESVRRNGAFQLPNPVGLVTPHAGPAWSGAVAAAAYRVIEQQQPEQIILLAFPHRGGLGRVATPDVDSIRTPFGDAAIDRSLESAFPGAPESRMCDHSFEIQLPFLQRASPRSRITPLYVGSLESVQRAHAAGVLAAAWHPGVVFVASSDFTHYGRAFGFEPFPNDPTVANRLRALDFECIDAAARLDGERFLATLQRNRATVCGAEPIALLLDVLRRLPGGGSYQTLLDYQTSGEMTGDFAHSVSYAALAYYDSGSFVLDAADSAALLESADHTLRRLRETGARKPVPAKGGSPALQVRRGLFVSLHSEGELLGCIGNMAGKSSLAEDVAELTLSSAMEDPRFRPAAEASGPIGIEISVLTPLRRIGSESEFRVGIHGAYLSLNGQSGLLLPQVATERGWSAQDFLKALARKSNLWPDAWRDPKAELYVFEAQIIRR